jgi:hypothetical protein
MTLILLLIGLLIIVGLLTYIVLLIEILGDEAEGIIYESDWLDEVILWLF